MARNWKVGEAVKAIQAGNKEDILDIGRRFPLFANLATQVNEAGVKMLECVPDYCTARKIESVLKGDVQESEGDSDDEAAEEEAPAKKAPAKKAAEKKAAPAKATKKAAKDEEEEEGDELEGKSAKQLYDMCVEAGLKVKPKQDKAVYIKALKEAEAEGDGDDEDWGDEEETPKKAPAKKEAKKAKKAADDDDDDDWDV